MAIEPKIFEAKIVHKRLNPIQNKFLYRQNYTAFSLYDLSKLKKWCFSVNKPNFFAFYENDLGHYNSINLLDWVLDAIKNVELDISDVADIIVITSPRVFFYTFNPISFFLVLDKSSNLMAVLAEVHNTYGEPHTYIIVKDDQTPISSEDVLHAKKALHVSPFFEVKGHYQFRFKWNDHKFSAWITYLVDGQVMLLTSMVGNLYPLTHKKLFTWLLKIPLWTFKTTLLIHYQAIILWVKGLKYFPKPKPPTEVFTTISGKKNEK